MYPNWQHINLKPKFFLVLSNIECDFIVPVKTFKNVTFMLSFYQYFENWSSQNLKFGRWFYEFMDKAGDKKISWAYSGSGGAGLHLSCSCYRLSPSCDFFGVGTWPAGLVHSGIRPAVWCWKGGFENLQTLPKPVQKSLAGVFSIPCDFLLWSVASVIPHSGHAWYLFH